MNKKVEPFVENIAESTVACLVTMVQGNVLALTLSHWIIASQTGVIAGTVTSVAILLARATKPWVISVALGVITGVVDFYVHPGTFGPFAVEAVVTGVGAAILSYVVSIIVRRVRKGPAARELV